MYIEVAIEELEHELEDLEANYESFRLSCNNNSNIMKNINRLINKTETFAGLARSKKCDRWTMRERAAISGRPDQWK